MTSANFQQSLTLQKLEKKRLELLHNVKIGEDYVATMREKLQVVEKQMDIEKRKTPQQRLVDDLVTFYIERVENNHISEDMFDGPAFNDLKRRLERERIPEIIENFKEKKLDGKNSFTIFIRQLNK